VSGNALRAWPSAYRWIASSSSRARLSRLAWYWHSCRNTPFLGRRFRDQTGRRLVAGRFANSLQAATASPTVPRGIDAASRVIVAR
jgi:hypothetical protein